MKNFIKTLTLSLTVLVLSGFYTQANVKHQFSALTHLQAFDKIAVSGNVKMVLIQDAKSGVEILDSYFSKNALIQTEGGVLRISSYNEKPLTVLVHVNELKSVTAGNQSQLSTAGKFQLLNLDLTLSGMAQADLNLAVVNLKLNIKNTATARIQGSAENYSVQAAHLDQVNRMAFAAKNEDAHILPVPTGKQQASFTDKEFTIIDQVIKRISE